MKIERKQEDFRIRNVKRIKRSRFPMSLFAIYLGVVLLMAGVHTGILVVAIKAHWNLIVQILFPIIYWGIVAGGLTLFTRKKVRETYEKPMLNFADAAGKVAAGGYHRYTAARRKIIWM
jgi:LytS/YehU family sensor histidine kinase